MSSIHYGYVQDLLKNNYAHEYRLKESEFDINCAGKITFSNPRDGHPR